MNRLETRRAELARLRKARADREQSNNFFFVSGEARAMDRQIKMVEKKIADLENQE